MQTSRMQRDLILRKQLQAIASRHLRKLVLAKNRRKAICDMAGELYDAFAAQRFKLVRNAVNAEQFQTESRTYLRVVLQWFDGIPLSDTELEAIQAEVANRRHAWVTKAYEVFVTPEGGLEKAAALRPLRWEDVEIRFLSDERIQIRVNHQLETRNYAEMNLVDRRNGTPNRAWLMLKELAESRGRIGMPRHGRHAQQWTQVEKRIQELRKALQSRFGLAADPLSYIKGSGYQALFKISCGPSYQT